jgi:hypothetical protein
MRKGRETAAFSLIELLVVIGIIAAVSVISVPVIRGLGQSNVVTSGTQQLVDDLMLARHKAMVGRTTVYVVFVPRTITDQPVPTGLNVREEKLWNRLRGGAYTTYALFAERSLGDQPGKRNARYITDWRTLPQGVFITTDEYQSLPPPQFDKEPGIDRPFAWKSFPFPIEQSRQQRQLPYIAFDQNGSLLQYKQTAQNVRVYEPEYIWMAKGSVLVARDGNTVSVDAREVPLGNSKDNYNRIRIDPISGRARLERPEIELAN